MIKHLFLCCLIPCALLLPSVELTGQAKIQTTSTTTMAKTIYTVKNVSGSVTLNGKQLKVGDKVSESDKSKILVSKNSYFELSEISGKYSLLYGPSGAASPSTPVEKTTLVNKSNYATEKQLITETSKKVIAPNTPPRKNDSPNKSKSKIKMIKPYKPQ